MRHRITTFLVAALAIAAIGPAAGTAVARQGADDPAGHVRHGHGADDSRATASRRHAARHHRHHSRTTRRGRGADDPVGHVRHGHGADDGPNHS